MLDKLFGSLNLSFLISRTGIMIFNLQICNEYQTQQNKSKTYIGMK